MTDREVVYKLRRMMQLGRWHISLKIKDLEDSFYGQLHLLRYVYDHPGCTQKDMAEHFAVSKAAVTKTVRRMIANGLLERKINGQDERKYEVYCTEKGARIHHQGDQIFRDVEKLTFEGFSEEELEKFGAYVDRVLENLETDYSRSKSLRELSEETQKQ